MKKSIFLLALVTMIVILPGCKKKKDYPVPSLTHLPIADSNYTHMVPLGQLNPPSHTLPTGHVYFSMKDHMAISDVFCPGALYLTAVSKNINGLGSANEFTEYILEFGDPSTGMVKFGHIQTVSADILAQVGAFPTSGCQQYTTGSNTFKNCKKDGLYIAVAAGQKIGTVGGQNDLYSMDLGISDNSGEISIQPYLSTDLLNQIRPKIGDGVHVRTIEPVCGQINVDVSGTAKGNWFFPGESHQLEDKQLALAQDNVDPTIPKISIGTSLTNQSSGVFDFDLQGSGVVNRDFTNVTPDGTTYCYNLKQADTSIGSSIIVKMVNATTLQVERRSCDCSCNTPYIFSGSAVTYNR